MKVGGQILWNVTPIWETSQIYHLMGRRPMKVGLQSKAELEHVRFELHALGWRAMQIPRCPVSGCAAGVDWNCKKTTCFSWSAFWKKSLRPPMLLGTVLFRTSGPLVMRSGDNSDCFWTSASVLNKTLVIWNAGPYCLLHGAARAAYFVKRVAWSICGVDHSSHCASDQLTRAHVQDCPKHTTHNPLSTHADRQTQTQTQTQTQNKTPSTNKNHQIDKTKT